MKPEQLAAALKVAVKELQAPKTLLQDVGAAALAASRARTPVRTGALRDSEYVLVGDNNVSLASDLDYSQYVHNGARYMEARPFFTEGIEDAMPNIERFLTAYGDKVLGKVAQG